MCRVETLNLRCSPNFINPVSLYSLLIQSGCSHGLQRAPRKRPTGTAHGRKRRHVSSRKQMCGSHMNRPPGTQKSDGPFTALW
eukprot:674380-Pelagomonas_calceolata.AAC.2